MLYTLIMSLAGSKDMNPLPDHNSDPDRQMNSLNSSNQNGHHEGKFTNIILCALQDSDIPRLQKFDTVSEEDIERMIMSMKSRSCKLDLILTMLLKDMQPILLQYLKEIINKSLTEGRFIERWKTEIVRPLLKKLGLELIKKNYRPVNNLFFLPKVVERCIQEQFNLYCAEFNLLPDFQFCT